MRDLARCSLLCLTGTLSKGIRRGWTAWGFNLDLFIHPCTPHQHATRWSCHVAVHVWRWEKKRIPHIGCDIHDIIRSCLYYVSCRLNWKKTPSSWQPQGAREGSLFRSRSSQAVGQALHFLFKAGIWPHEPLEKYANRIRTSVTCLIQWLMATH